MSDDRPDPTEDIPRAEQIAAMRTVITDMESVKRRTPQYDRMIVAMRAALDQLLKLRPEGGE
jgi:hypothetical protein